MESHKSIPKNKIEFNYFEIKGLYGHLDIKVPFIDNKIILIGNNGEYKTTVLNLFYYFIKGENKGIDKLRRDMGIELKLSYKTNKNHTVSLNTPMLMYYDDLVGLDEDDFQEYCEENDIQQADLQEVYEDLYLYDQFINKIIETMDIIYLPTYRHSEQNIIQVLIETLRENDYQYRRPPMRRDFDDEREYRIRREYREYDRHLLHSLERNMSNDNLYMFTGMVQVYRNIKDYQQSIRDQINEAFIENTQNVLRTIGKGDSTQTWTEEELKSLIEFYAQTVDTKKWNVQDIVNNIHKNPAFNGYISSLINTKKRVAEKGTILHNFFEKCNSYLSYKHFNYDKISYAWTILSEHKINNKETEIKLTDLSSGEQQLISMFQKLYLRDNNRKLFIFIDEPEISLSLKWQTTFIKDLIFDGKAMGGFIVTHAPMVIENLDQQYVSSMKEIIPQLNKQVEENEQ